MRFVSMPAPAALAVAFILATSVQVHAQTRATDVPLPIIGITADTADPVGLEVLSKLRDAIKRAGYYPSTNAAEPLVGLHFLSVDARADSSGVQTLYSVAWTTRDGRFVTHNVATCTLKAAADCANAIMVTTSQVAEMQKAREASQKVAR